MVAEGESFAAAWVVSPATGMGWGLTWCSEFFNL